MLAKGADIGDFTKSGTLIAYERRRTNFTIIAAQLVNPQMGLAPRGPS